jgi:SAM-dependent methyltransferase
MTILDKRGILDGLASREVVILELGCGDRKRDESWVGIDALDRPGVDIVGDVYEILGVIGDASVDEVHTFHFLEHLSGLSELLAELGRVLKPAGVLEIVVPHFSNPYYYSDYTHRKFFGLYSLSYLAEDRVLRRRVPRYVDEVDFELTRVDLVFKSSPPFYGRHVIKKIVGFFFNLTRYTRELYEENFCHLFPCYEIRFLLRRK